MQDGSSLSFSNRVLGDGVWLHSSQNQNNKSVRIDVFLVSELVFPQHTYTHLLSRLCERGSHNYPSARELNRQFELLFGTYFGTNSLNIAGNSLLHLSIDVVNSENCRRFGGTNSLTQACSLLFEILYKPNLTPNCYFDDVVAHEKQIISTNLASVLNDKINYAQSRCVEETGRGTVWSVSAPAKLTDLEKADGKQILDHYKSLISKCPIHVFVSGKVSHKDLCMIEATVMRDLPDRTPIEVPILPALNARPSKTIFEMQKVSQAKYVVSYYTGPVFDFDFYANLLVFDSLWGGDSHGILSRELREKQGICYFVDSHVERYSGVIYTVVSCSNSDFDLVSRSIDKAMDYIRHQQFPKEYVFKSKALIKNRLISAMYDRNSMLRICLSSIITKQSIDIFKLNASIDKVTGFGVSETAKKLIKGVEYFLYEDQGNNYR